MSQWGPPSWTAGLLANLQLWFYFPASNRKIENYIQTAEEWKGGRKEGRKSTLFGSNPSASFFFRKKIKHAMAVPPPCRQYISLLITAKYRPHESPSIINDWPIQSRPSRPPDSIASVSICLFPSVIIVGRRKGETVIIIYCPARLDLFFEDGLER
jgi:hypothetical protein